MNLSWTRYNLNKYFTKERSAMKINWPRFANSYPYNSMNAIIVLFDINDNEVRGVTKRIIYLDYFSESFIDILSKLGD